MSDIIIIVILICLVGGAAAYIYRARKKGQKCIGCPYCDECSKKSCGGCKSEKK